MSVNKKSIYREDDTVFKYISYSIDLVIVVLLLVLSLKKGGFFKSDVIFFNFTLNIIFIVKVIFSYFSNRKYNSNNENKRNRDNKINLLLILFAFSYLIPVILRNYSSLNDSIFEMIRYFSLYLVYYIVKNSDNKKIYVYAIAAIATILGIIGIDQISCGVLDDVFDMFGTGYLVSINSDRMSSVIQYANVFSIICLIAYIFISHIEKENIECLNKEKWKYVFIQVIKNILLSSIILSSSKLVILLTISFCIYDQIKKKKFSIFDILNYVLVVIYVSIVLNLIQNNREYIYLCFIIFCIVTIIQKVVYINIVKVLSKNIEGKSIKIKNILKGNKIKIGCICGIVLIYILLAFNIKTDTKIYSNNSKPYVSYNIYDIKEKTNNVLVDVEKLQDNTKYQIEIYQVKKDGKYVLEYRNENSISNYVINNIDDLKCININISCIEGKIRIKNININDKDYSKKYVLLPSSLLKRVYDEINLSSSFSLRKEYAKDAIKISTSNIKKFLFGIGGEGFRNEYKYYKTVDYSSTEVHNIYLQILVESGIIGLLLFLSIIIVALRKSKNNYFKISLLILLFHGLFDLDFSYMIIIMMFAVILGLQENNNLSYNENCNKKESKFKDFLDIISKCLTFSLFMITTIILFNSCRAMLVSTNKLNKEDNVKKAQEKIVNYEKRVNIDTFDFDYRLELNEEYQTYISILDKNIKKIDNIDSIDNKNTNEIKLLKDEYNRVLFNLKYNLNLMLENEGKNTNNLIDITNEYFNNIEKIITINTEAKDDENVYNIDKYKAYEYYLNIINSNLEILNNINDENINSKVKKISKQYIRELYNLVNSDEKLNEITYKYIDIFSKL